MKGVPIRKCIICANTKERNQLLRMMRDHISGALIINPTVKQFGRSSYVCKDGDCREKLAKHKKFSKSFCVPEIKEE